MNAQEIFNKVATHLMTQGERSIGITGLCAYRGIKGLTCAVGCLISDEAYIWTLENRRACSRQVREALELSGIDEKKHRDLLADLQQVHDQNTPEQWSRCLARIAKERGLSPDASLIPKKE